MDRLIRGYREFRKARWPKERADAEKLAKHGQHPEYLLISCCDSRADPAMVFNTRPGELFVVRNIAAVVPPHEDGGQGYYGTRSAIAYAVLALKVRNIVVMGHAQCGGVAAAMSDHGADGIPYLAPWVELVKPAVARHVAISDEHQKRHAVERESVILSVERLLGYPFVAERVKSGALTVGGMRFGIADGVLEVLDRAKGKFSPVARPSFFERLTGRAGA